MNTPRTTGSMKWKLAPLWVSLAYLLLGSAWVYLSTIWLQHHVFDSRLVDALWKAKAIGFVFVTAVAFYFVMSFLLSQRDRATGGLRTSEERFRAVFERHPYPMWAFNTKTLRFLAVNDAAVRHYGYSRDEFLAMTLLDIRPREDHEKLRQVIASPEGQNAHRAVWRHITKDGRRLDVDVSTHGIPWLDHEPVRLATVVDITDRVRAETAVHESEVRYRRIVETAEEGIWLVDNEWKTTFVNARLGRILGYTVDEMVGKHIFEFMDAEARLVAQRNMSRREEGVAEEHDFRFKHRNGSDVWVLISTNAIAAGDGTFIGALAMVTDITHRKAIERLREDEAGVLAMIATGRDLRQTLEAVTRMIQASEPGTMASVLLLEDGKTVRTIAAPDLPEEYCRAVDGLQIGPTAGSCGTAMFRKERVIVTDIATDPLWTQFRTVTAKFGLGACWSEPILDSHGEVLGSLAMYYREAREPRDQQLTLISSSAYLAGIAIERWRDEKALRGSEATNRAILDALPDMIFRVDRDLKFLDCHVPDARLLTVPPEQFMGKRLRDVFPPDRAELPERHLARLFETGTPQSFETSVVHPLFGKMTWDVRMVLSKTGEAVMISRNVTSERGAQIALRESQRRLELLVSRTPLGVIFWDDQFRVESWNAAAEKLFGWTADEARGRHWTFVVPETERGYVTGVTEALLANEGGLRGTNHNVRKDGKIISCEWYNTSLVDEKGRVIGVASIAEDVTERLEFQRRQDMMLRELDHRVKNNLASIASLAEQTSRSARDPREFVESFTGRLRAMARLHNLLSRSHGEGVDLTAVVRQTLDTFSADRNARATIAGESIQLDARAGQAFALALNELCTNAIKYGALSTAEGRIEVRWTIEAPAALANEPVARSATDADGERALRLATLQITWTETGGPVVVEPTRRGFGSELIQGLIAHELGGTVVTRYDPSGVVCVLRVPIDAAAAKGLQGERAAIPGISLGRADE